MKDTIEVYDTISKRIVEIEVDEEFAKEYKRMIWKEENSDRAFRKHQTVTSQLKGGEDDSFENFHEFIVDDEYGGSDNTAIRRSYLKRIKKCLSAFNKLNVKIRIAYTYYIYHNYSIAELAEVSHVSEKTMTKWILTAAYVIDGKYVKLDDWGFIEPKFMTNIYKRFPEAVGCPKCKDCVWADMKTGHRICFRDCDHYDHFQRRCSE